MTYRVIAAATAFACAATAPANAQQAGLPTKATLGLDELSSDDCLNGAADNIDDGLSGAGADFAVGHDVALAPGIIVGVETTEVTRAGENEGTLRLGAGIEHALASRPYVKAEYRRTRYGDDVAYHSATTRHQLFAGVGLRF